MKIVEPEVFLLSSPKIDWVAIDAYLKDVGGQEWLERAQEDAPHAQTLAEFAGRICYRSWQPGLNPNVTRVRTDQDAYFESILSSAHGSILEHANFTFVLHNVSRVLTHELVRHRAGIAVSQESLRFVRLEELPFWFPGWAVQDEELMSRARNILTILEEFQGWMAEHFDLDAEGAKFHEKKEKTSFMRRFAPEGVGTGIVMTGNIRALRHVIESRTAPGAEEEIRLVFGKVASIMKMEAPALFADFEVLDGAWVPKYRKV